MTLEEMLALLADNSSGDISASDMRQIVTGLWDNSVALAGAAQTAAGNAQTAATNAGDAASNYASTTNARIDGLEAATTSRSFAGVYRLDVAPNGNPAAGEVTTDTGALVGAAHLTFADTDRNNTDASAALQIAEHVSVQDKDNSTNWAKWDVTGAITNVFGDWRLPVTVTGNGGAIAGGNNDLLVVFTWTAP